MNIVLFFCYCWVSYLRLLKKPPQFEQIEQEVQLQWTPGIYRSNQNYCITISMQKIRSIHKLILKIQQILSSNELKSKGFFFTKPTQKSLNQLLPFTNFYQHPKSQFIPSVHFWDRVNFEFSWPDWPHPFLTMSTPNIFNHHLICLNLYQHAKNQLFHQFILRYSQF